MGQLKMSRAGNIEIKKRSGAADLLCVLEPVDIVDGIDCTIVIESIRELSETPNSTEIVCRPVFASFET